MVVNTMAGLRFPPSTLQRVPHGTHRMTRGRGYSLRLQRGTLASSTPGRSARRTIHFFSQLALQFKRCLFLWYLF